MSNLYDVVRSVVNSKSQEETSKILYGNNVINLNSKEYYQKIVSMFVQKKEHVIKKTKW